MNTRDFLFGLEPQIKVVNIGGEKVYVKEMSVGVRAKYETDLLNFTQGKSAQLETRSSILLHCVVNENGERAFKDADIGKIKLMPSIVATKLFDAIIEISGLSDKEIEEGKQE